MKKILQVNKYFPPHIGGIESVVKLYADSLSLNNKVRVLVCNDATNRPSKVDKHKRYLVIYSRTLWIIRKLPISLAFVSNFFRLKSWAEIVHIHEPFPLGSLIILLFLRNKKIFITWHSDIVNQKYFGAIVKPIQNLLLNKATLIMTTSENLARCSKQLSKVIEKIEVLPLSINTDAYTKTSDCDTSAIHPELVNLDKFCFTFGRLSYYKGIDVLVKAYIDHADSLPPLVIAGVGQMSQIIVEAQKIVQNKIIFINRHLTELEKSVLLDKCSFFVFPSTHASEAFGLTQLEAMLHAKAIINTFLQTGVPWVSLDRITGLTVPVGDSDKLAEAISYLHKNELQTLAFGEAARSRVIDHFSDDVVLSRLNEIYENSKYVL